MTPILDFRTFIADHLSSVSVPVYQDLIPEGVEEAACAVTFISVDEDRVLDGGISGKMNTFRVAVVAVDDSDVKSIVEDLEQLDNTRTSDYSRIFAQLVNWEARESNQPYRRAHVDVRVYQ